MFLAILDHSFYSSFPGDHRNDEICVYVTVSLLEGSHITSSCRLIVTETGQLARRGLIKLLVQGM